MFFENNITQIDTQATVRAVNETLRRIDIRLVDHGERVAFIASEIAKFACSKLDRDKLLLLSVFHDIGAYKTDEIDRMVQFETHDAWNHAIYGYLFMKYMTPLSDVAEAILYHHTDYCDMSALDEEVRDYASLICLADRIDIAFLYGKQESEFFKLWYNDGNRFNGLYLQAFKDCYARSRMFERLTDGSYRDDLKRIIKEVKTSPKEALSYLKMLVYSIDFRSEHTVTHTVNTVSIALDIANYFGQDEQTKEKIYLGALLHDVGKMAIPIEILEYPGRLSDEQMVIMRTHVAETEKLIHGVVSDEICNIAVRHHEKLDGSGYPHRIKGEELSFPERIVAVSDIVSALGSRRSYKEPFPRDKTIDILNSMKGIKLDERICNYVSDNYDRIMRDTDCERDEIIRRYQAMSNEYIEIKARF